MPSFDGWMSMEPAQRDIYVHTHAQGQDLVGLTNLALRQDLMDVWFTAEESAIFRRFGYLILNVNA
jgi:hypothetical protein